MPGDKSNVKFQIS